MNLAKKKKLIFIKNGINNEVHHPDFVDVETLAEELGIKVHFSAANR